jgi:peptide-methionine (S)-S-oxide reductase
VVTADDEYPRHGRGYKPFAPLDDPMTETATFGGGCFWCTEAAMKELAGVESVTSGYAGGDTENPTYKAVCSGTTGHAEVVQVAYDPEVIGYADLLEVFFATHDPTQLNRQGPDVGTQYRSIVLYHDDEQREQAAAYIEALDSEYDDDVVTELEPLGTFWEAEEYHQDYYEKNPNDAYCNFHARPKVEKVREKFAEKVRLDAD